MENSLDHLEEDHHFAIRQHLQGELIRDFYGVDDARKVTNSQAYAWLKPNAAVFDVVFKNAVEEHPSFWDDAEKDPQAAFALLKQKFIEREHGEK